MITATALKLPPNKVIGHLRSVVVNYQCIFRDAHHDNHKNLARVPNALTNTSALAAAAANGTSSHGPFHAKMARGAGRWRKEGGGAKAL